MLWNGAWVTYDVMAFGVRHVYHKVMILLWTGARVTHGAIACGIRKAYYSVIGCMPDNDQVKQWYVYAGRVAVHIRDEIIAGRTVSVLRDIWSMP